MLGLHDKFGSRKIMLHYLLIANYGTSVPPVQLFNFQSDHMTKQICNM